MEITAKKNIDRWVITLWFDNPSKASGEKIVFDVLHDGNVSNAEVITSQINLPTGGNLFAMLERAARDDNDG